MHWGRTARASWRVHNLDGDNRDHLAQLTSSRSIVIIVIAVVIGHADRVAACAVALGVLVARAAADHDAAVAVLDAIVAVLVVAVGVLGAAAQAVDVVAAEAL